MDAVVKTCGVFIELRRSGFPPMWSVGKYFKLEFLLSTHLIFFMSVVAFSSCAVTLYLTPCALWPDLSERFTISTVPCKLLGLLHAPRISLILKKTFIFYPLALGNCKQPNGQKNSAEICKYYDKLEGWVLGFFFFDSWSEHKFEGS